MTEPLCLTDLHEASPGLRRMAHSYTTSGTMIRFAGRGLQVSRELLSALPRDLIAAFRRTPYVPLRMEDGVRPARDARQIALYVHYSASGQVSEMVRRQLALVERFGFAIVFISMAARIPEDDWQAVRGVCALVVHRRNLGRDFGAWKDLMPEISRRWPDIEELVLMNDSVLGPIHAAEPVIETMRRGGDGLFGLTESLQGGAHLQSYMLLAHGRSAVADVMHFIQGMHISHSKWLLVQLGEIRLARWMRKRGHRVAAVFGYDRLARAAASDPAERERLENSYRRLKGLTTVPDDQAAEMLHAWPLNPTHHMWHLLATRFGAPFLKTELVMRNPGRLPGVSDWPAVVPPNSPCPLPVLRAHLETMKAV